MLLEFGVYFNVVPFIVHVHLVAGVFTPLNVNDHDPQVHSFAFDAIKNCANVIVFAVFQIHHVVKSVAVGATSSHVAVFTELHVPLH